MKKSRMGRPPKPKGEARPERFQIRLNPDERKTLDAAAKLAGADTSTWAREALLKLARRMLPQE